MGTARKTEPGEAWVSLSAAAVMLGESRPTVLKRAVKGELVAQHIAGRTVVSRASIEKLVDRRTARAG